MTTSEVASVIRTDYERQSQDDWDNKTNDPINLRLGEEDGLYHHHFGIGDVDPTIFAAPAQKIERRILSEMHRMENDQVELVLQGLAPLGPDARVMDGGSGRGGTSFLINRRFGCSVVGVNFCSHHLDFARQVGQQNGWDDKVSFVYANMADTGLPAGSFDAIVTNETTMYVDLNEAFAEFARLLRPGGRYVTVTWCRNDAVPTGTAVNDIDQHYVCHIHPRSTYLRALAENGLVPTTVQDLTPDAVPYWQLRSRSRLATGVEQPFLDGYRTGELNYFAIVAEKSLSA